MKNKTLLCLAIGLCLSATAMATGGPPGYSEDTHVKIVKKTPVMDYSATVIESYESYMLTNQVALMADPIVLDLSSPEAVTEPVTRTYRYVFIKRFDWRCQKK